MPYEKDGVQYPSVTGILGVLEKPALLYWSANCAVDYIKENLEKIKDPFDVHAGEDVLMTARRAFKTISKEATDSGKKAHTAVELYIKGEEYDYVLDNDEKAQTAFLAFLEWEEKNHVEWMLVEVPVFSVKVGYAGRFDAIAKVNGHVYLVDFKTSKAIYDEYRDQLIAYRQAFNEDLPEGFDLIENLGVLRLDKETGAPEWKDVTKGKQPIERREKWFNTMTEAYYLDKNRRLKNNPFVKAAKGEALFQGEVVRVRYYSPPPTKIEWSRLRKHICTFEKTMDLTWVKQRQWFCDGEELDLSDGLIFYSGASIVQTVKNVLHQKHKCYCGKEKWEEVK